MRTRYALFLLLTLSFLGSVASVQSQQSSADTARKLVRKVDPRYPELAKRMNLSGTVRVIAVVATDGSVKMVEPVGGSPVLVQAAQTAVSQWKFAPGSETKETVELHFRP